MVSHIIAVAIARHKNKYLVLKRNSNKNHAPNEWEFCGGSLEGKEHGEEAALREMKEETGLSGEIIKTGKVLENINGDDRLIVIPFIVEVFDETVIISEEHTEYKWCELEEARTIGKWTRFFLSAFGI